MQNKIILVGLCVLLIFNIGCRDSENVLDIFKQYCKSNGYEKLTDYDSDDTLYYYLNSEKTYIYDIECDGNIITIVCSVKEECLKEDKWGNCEKEWHTQECKNHKTP